MIDDNLKKSVQTRFFLGQSQEEQEVITKESMVKLSDGLTSIQNAFNQIKAYTGNVAKIQKAVAAARVDSKKETAIEQRNVAPVDRSNDRIASLFPELTKALNELRDSFEKLDLGQTGDGQQGDMGGGGGGMGLLGTLATGAAVAGLGYMAFSGDEAEAATPEPEPQPEPQPQPQPAAPAASEVADKANERVAERRAESEQSDTRRVQKQVIQEQQTERLTETVERAVERPTSVTRAAAPAATNNWTDNLSNYINRSVEVAESRAAAAAAGGGGGDMGASGGEDMGGGGDLTSGSYDMKLAGLLANYEGVETSAYRDARGIPTIGIGATYYPPGFRLQGRVQMGQRITEEEARQIKAAHVEEHRGRLLRSISSSEYSSMPDGVKAALESMVFNYGSMRNFPTLVQLTKEGVRTRNYRPVSNFFRTTLASHNNGLNGWRRNDEAALIDTGRSPRARISFGGGSTAGEAAAGGGTFRSGSASRVQEFASGAVRGMSAGQGQQQLQSMGISGGNGRLPESSLRRLTAPGTTHHRAAPAAAAGMSALVIAAARQGIRIGVTDSYRSYDQQVELKRRKPGLAARPGTSNHGWGLAFDLSDGGRALTQSSAAYRFLKANGPRFGIYGPLARANGSIYEIWHWEYRGGGSASPNTPTVPVTNPEQQVAAGSPRLRTPAGGTINAAAAASPRGGECHCPEPTVVAVPGGGAPSPTDYLRGVRPAQATRRYNVDTSQDYRVYFNAA